MTIKQKEIFNEITRLKKEIEELRDFAYEEAPRIAAKEMESIRRERDRLRAALEAVEWVYFGADITSYDACPACDEIQTDGHAPDCQIRQALAPEASDEQSNKGGQAR